MKAAGLITLAFLAAASARAQAPAAPTDGALTAVEVFQTTMWREMLAADRKAALGDWGGASTNLLKLAAEAPENLLLLEKSALALERAGRWADARDQWAAFSSRSPDRPDSLVRLGKCHLMLDRLPDASKALGAAEALNPEALEPRLLRAALMIRESPDADLSEILRALTVGQMGTMLYWLSADPPLREDFLGPGRTTLLARWILGGGVTAVAPEARGAEPSPRSLRMAAGVLNRCDHAMQVRNRERARAALSAAAELGARGPFIDAYGAFLDMGEGRGIEARRQMDNLILSHPREFSLRYFLGIMLLEHNQPADAVEPLRKAVDLSHRRPDIMFAHACALAGAGRNEEALLQLKSMTRRDKEAALQLLGQNAPALNPLRKTKSYQEWFASLRPAPEEEP